ncbi:MAG: hypothetical protein M3322_12190 [Actinomycetota bacterium]|nr:hypothetical protein [Actinomycetota bacterium]
MLRRPRRSLTNLGDGGETLQDLQGHPRFVFNAPNLQPGVLFPFSKPYLCDYRLGKVENPRTELAVAASAAFPPFLSRVVLRCSDSDFLPNSGTDLQHPAFTSRVVLADRGVYDDLGLETG